MLVKAVQYYREMGCWNACKAAFYILMHQESKWTSYKPFHFEINACEACFIAVQNSVALLLKVPSPWNVFFAPLRVWGTCFLEECIMTWDKIPPGFWGIDSAQELPYCNIFFMVVYLMSPNWVQWPFYYFVLQFSGKLCKWCHSLLPFLFSLPPPTQESGGFHPEGDFYFTSKRRCHYILTHFWFCGFLNTFYWSKLTGVFL